MNAHNAQSAVAFSVSAAGLVFGGWLLFKAWVELCAAFTNTRGVLR